MAHSQRQYKQIRFGFGSVAESRLIHAGERQETRKKERAHALNKIRNISESSNNTSRNKGSALVSANESREIRLQKWKAERDLRKKLEKMKEKPPFKVGKGHQQECLSKNNTKVNSSIPSQKPNKHVAMTHVSSHTKGITKATEKRLIAKAQAQTLKIEPCERGKTRKKAKNTEQLPIPDDHSAKADSSESLMFGRIPVQMVIHDKTNKPVLSSEKDIALEEKNDRLDIVLGHNNSKENTSLFNISKTNEDNNIVDSSIEAVSLRLSFPEEDAVNSSKDKIQVINNSTHNESEPAFFSPYIVSSRGKSSARKEQQIRRGFSIDHSPTEDIPTKDTVMKNLNISVEDEERTAQYFHFLLNKERKRLNELCKRWEEIKLESNLTEDTHYLINQAVGQTCLLINKKFERFRGLVSDCETEKGEMLVTCSDLQGFWDMMYMEVKNCDSRFDYLENLRSRSWVEESQLTEPITKKKITAKKKVTTKKKMAPGKTSSIRQFLLEKKKMAQKANTGASNITNQPILSEKFEKDKGSPRPKNKSRRSTSVGSGDRKSTPAKRESTRMSLLQKVQLSEASRKVRSPLTIMKISKLYKTPDVQLDNTISYVNSDQTPGKSILKPVKDRTDSESREESTIDVQLDDTISYVNSNQTPGKSILKPLRDMTESESCTKSTHKVNFDDRVVLNEVPIDEETHTKIDLANALARIDSLDFDDPEETVPTKVERRLIFDDESFDESHDMHDTDAQLSYIPNFNNATVLKAQSTPLVQESLIDSRLKSSRKSLRRQNTVSENTMEIPSINIISSTPARENLQMEVSSEEEKDFEEINTSIRVLRNRTVSSNCTPKTNVASSKRISNKSTPKENKTPISLRKKSLRKASSEKKNSKSKIHEDGSIERISLGATSDKRRKSTKRNVTFGAKDSLKYSENEPEGFPMTPHVRRSKVRSNEEQEESDVSHEMPKKTPERIRRSEHKKL